jgi:putative secretion ATPase (PEP-CTERM system associated)
MYERFYQLRERPFALSPDPDYLYPSRVHQEALDHLRYGLETQAGFIVVTGEIGSGKTTLLQTLLRNLDNQTTVGRLVNTMLEPSELLESIMIDFGLDPAGKSKPMLLRDLSQYLVDQRVAGRLVLLVIDEAQNLGLASLEELRMLSNLETEKSKLVQIVLVGQPDLREKLGAPELEQLRQRITVSYHLPPLDADETFHYINHRLRRAAAGPPLIFPVEATNLVHARSRGVPRIINVICDAALVFGYAEERRIFDAATIAEVLQELELTGVLPPQRQPERATATAVPAAAVPSAISAAAPAAARAPEVRPPTSDDHRPISNLGPRTSDVGPRISNLGPPASDLRPPTSDLRPPTSDVSPSPARRDLAAVGTMGPDPRIADLERRERMILQREQELAEQRRVLAEEYRLLHARRTAAAPRFEPAAAQRFDTGQETTLWNRFKRFMLGVSPS